MRYEWMKVKIGNEEYHFPKHIVKIRWKLPDKTGAAVLIYLPKGGRPNGELTSEGVFELLEFQKRTGFDVHTGENNLERAMWYMEDTKRLMAERERMQVAKDFYDDLKKL